ncbi:choice-of-anchor P family protein [Streptomyces sp. NPDC005708]|uniref:choice-of-anchor P family protein n=1 Tax=Streptomyces sp. NPDC005708 TaxID=3154564 RepID=UPI0033C17D26
MSTQLRLRARLCAGVAATAMLVLGLQGTAAAVTAAQPDHASAAAAKTAAAKSVQPAKATAPHVSVRSTSASASAANSAATAATSPAAPSGPGPNGKYGFAWARPASAVTPSTTTTPTTKLSATGKATSPTVAPSYTHEPAPAPSYDLPRGTGPVMHSITISLVFWLPPGRHFEADPNRDAAFENLQQRWVQDTGNTPFYNLLTQYYDDSGHISNSVSFGGSYVDTRAYPHDGTMARPLTAGDITDEVSHAVAAKGWAEDSTHLVAVFTGRDVQQCSVPDAPNGCTFVDGGKHTGAYCAYHDHFDDNGKDAIYAFMGNDDGDHGGPSCDVGGSSPNGDMAADSEISTLSHEVIEAVTDPHPNQSWTQKGDPSGGEIGDKCAYKFTPRDDSGADVYLHGHPYIVQEEYSNAVHTCAADMCVIGGKDNVCPPQVTAAETVDNPNPAIGSTITYTVRLQNSDDTGAAANLTVKGPLPDGYTVTGLSAPESTSQTSDANSFTVGYDTLAVHQSRTITVKATVPVQVGTPASACSTIALQDLLSAAQPSVKSSPCGSTTPGKIRTSLTYTGPTSEDYHDAFTATAHLIGGGSALSGGPVVFTLGGAHCTATTDGSGNAGCSLTPVDAAGTVTLHADYAGDGTHLASSDTAAFTIKKEETTLAYTGSKHVANGVPATLSGVLKEDGTSGIAGRTVKIALGAGTSEQDCTGTTDSDGTVSCTIQLVDQPLNDTATVPVAVTFAGDGYYLPSSASATVRLEYYTGRSFGLSANVNLLLAPLTIPPQPDTGPIRTAHASSTTTPCSVTVNALLLSANGLCANVTTTLAPGTSTATATVQNASIGLPGLPVIGISGLTATSVSSCTATHGSAMLTLTIAGVPVTVPTAPNSVIGLPGGARLVVNEQTSVPGADFGTTVNAVHLVVPSLLGGTTADVIVGSATSDAHNCS